MIGSGPSVEIPTSVATYTKPPTSTEVQIKPVVSKAEATIGTIGDINKRQVEAETVVEGKLQPPPQKRRSRNYFWMQSWRELENIEKTEIEAEDSYFNPQV